MDLISRKEATIKSCSIRKMLDDYLSKPLFGKLFHMMRRDVMNVALREYANRIEQRVTIPMQKLTSDF